MDTRHAVHPRDFQSYAAATMRQEFLIQGLFASGAVKMVYSFVDRMIAGGVCPVEPLRLEAGAQLRAAYFLERRELGVINIGPPGTVTVDGTAYRLNQRDGLYVGMGSREIAFSSDDPNAPAKFYFNSAPAHQTYPTQKIGISQAESEHLGALSSSNERTIYRYIHPKGVPSCQLVMGMTILEPGSVWNTMPCHTHDRRMEVYLYINLPQDAAVFHLMGEPEETRHLVVRNEEAVISPSWSIHAGVGTKNYAFIWGMAGENQVFADMDPVAMERLK